MAFSRLLAAACLTGALAWAPAANAGCGDPGAAPCGPSWVPAPLRAVLIPQVGLGADFRPACAEHDRCYTRGYRDPNGRRPGQYECDRRFLRRLDRACDSAVFPPLCRMRARLDYVAVRLYGKLSFDTP